MHTDRIRKGYAATGLLALAAATAWAGEPPVGGGAPDQANPDATLLDLATMEGAAPLSADKLDASTAKAQIQVDKIQISKNDLNGVVSDNVATGNHTGNNSVSDGAFSSSTGFMTTVQNTGNNVLIQNATIINVSVGP